MHAESLQVRGNKKTKLSGKNRHTWVEDLQFSPDSRKIAIGTHGGLSKVEIITINSEGKPTGTFETSAVFSSAMTAVDWTLDGQVVRVNDQAGALQWVNTESKGSVSASSTKNFDYATTHCRTCWETTGMWQGIDTSDINTCDRSRNSTLLAVGDDFGQVILYKFPCVGKKSEGREFYGHSSHVTKVRFSANDKYVVSTGGNDMTVMVWETDIGGFTEMVDDEEAEYEDDPDDPAFESKQDIRRINAEQERIQR